MGDLDDISKAFPAAWSGARASLPEAAPTSPRDVLVSPAVLEELRRCTRAAAPVLAGGLLLGRACRSADATRRWLEVRQVYTDTAGLHATEATLTFTAEYWTAFFAGAPEDLEVVGWFLGLEDLEFSPKNREVHRQFFAEEDRVHLVASPGSGRCALYWHPGGARSGSEPVRVELG